MTLSWPRAGGPPVGSGVLRSCPEDFQVREELGFEPSGAGEHAFLYLQKRELNSADLVERVARLSGVEQRNIGISGLKDRNAVTQQWLSVGLAGAPEPNWQGLEDNGDIQVLEVNRHQRKLRRGVHKSNRFCLRLREFRGDREAVEARLALLQTQGVPNYFGEQRFGRNGNTLQQALEQVRSEGRRGRKLSRRKRGLFYSALRGYLFNEFLARRVETDTWNKIASGDVCILEGSRSNFICEDVDAAINERCEQADVHPGLPLWGSRGSRSESASYVRATQILEQSDSENAATSAYLESEGLELSWRATRLMPHDFCWQFCDDDSLQLDFALGAGCYATALLAEFVDYAK